WGCARGSVRRYQAAKASSSASAVWSSLTPSTIPVRADIRLPSLSRCLAYEEWAEPGDRRVIADVQSAFLLRGIVELARLVQVGAESRHPQSRTLHDPDSAVDVARDREVLIPAEVALPLDDRAGAVGRERPEAAAALLHRAANDQAVLVPARRVADVLAGFVDDAAAEVADRLVRVRVIAAGVALDGRSELPADPERLEGRGQRGGI